MKTLTFYIDMDGVLADFNKEANAVERFATEKGFFANLDPIRPHVSGVKMMIQNGTRVKILSASPNEQADKDKLLWLKEHLPQISEDNIILCRVGDNKADYVEDIENAVLFDDYGKNIREFRARGGHAYKIVNKKQIFESVVG